MAQSAEGLKFAILSTVRNAERWIGQSVMSALNQEYSHFKYILTDDASTDGTQFHAFNTFTVHPRRAAVTLLRNRVRVGALANYRRMAMEFCADDDIIIMLDGDDWFPHADVLTRLAQEYADPNVWMTYGSFAYDEASRAPHDSEGRGFAGQVPDVQHTRQSGWRSTHLKTFYRWLFALVREDDLKRDGQWIDPAWDLPIMYPMLEMATAKHARYIHDILYIYNIQNPFNDVKVNKDAQTDMARYVEAQPIYKPLGARR